MTIRLAQGVDQEKIRKYDRHIRHSMLEECIRNQRVYVLEEGKDLVGVLRYSLFWQSIPFLDLIYLEEAYRGRGYGKKLMAHWEATMQARGYRYAMLSTQEDERAKYFYEKLGYRRIGAFLPPDQAADELMYSKTLA